MDSFNVRWRKIDDADKVTLTGTLSSRANLGLFEV
jgi:hypothetical protein